MDSLAKLIHLAQITGSINILCQFKGEWFNILMLPVIWAR